MSKMLPIIRFRGFTDDWEKHKLGDITGYIKGYAFKSKDYQNDGYRIIRVSDLGKDNIRVSNDPIFVSEEIAKQQIRYSIKENEIIITTVGSKAEMKESAVGRPVIVTESAGYLLNQNLVKVYGKSKFNSYFIYTQLLQTKYTDYISMIERGNANQANITINDLWSYRLLTPTYEEQQKIGSFFKQLDDTIALHQRMLDLLKEQKKGYLQKMFPKNGAKVPELRFAGFADDWEERKLGDVGDTFTGLTGKTKEDFGHGSAKFVTYVNVFQNPIATLDQLDAIEIDEKQNQVQKGDVFFTTSSETPEEVGMSSVWTHDTKNVYLNSFTFGYRPRVSFDLNYMASMLRSPSIRKKITFLAQGISRYNISKTKMLEIEIPTPNLSEQEKIGSFFKQLDNTIALHQRMLDLLKKQKKGFLQKMFVS
ncbi:restriction endonuclease subunit S [Leuconostoc citreum]